MEPCLNPNMTLTIFSFCIEGLSVAALQLFNSSPRVSMLLTVTPLLSLVTDSTDHIVTDGSNILVYST